MNVRHLLTFFFAFSLFLNAGCAHHPRVTLELPHNDAPPAQRRAVYHRLKLKRIQSDVFVLYSGEQIHDFRDLLPVVMTSSSTARTIRKYQRARRRADLAYGLGIPLSIVVPLGLLSFIPISQIPGDNSKLYAAIALGTGVLLAGLVASFVVGVQMNQRMLQLQQQIARTYNKDLRFFMEIKNPE